MKHFATQMKVLRQLCQCHRKTVLKKVYPETVLEKLWLAFVLMIGLTCGLRLIDWFSRHLRWVP